MQRDIDCRRFEGPREDLSAGAAVGGADCVHLDPMRSTLDDPDRLAQARVDEQAFADKWGITHPLWLAENRP